MRLRFLLALPAVLWALPVSPLAAQEVNPIAISLYGGYATDPGGFDVFRNSSFDGGVSYGGSLGFRLAPNVGVRGDIAVAKSSGRETGAVNESVTFDRNYYGVAVEGRFPLAVVTPYILVGGGMVSVDRRAPSLTYYFSEMAGRAGAGLSFQLPGFPVEAFTEANQWIYERMTTGEGLQMDTILSVGITFSPRF